MSDEYLSIHDAAERMGTTERELGKFLSRFAIRRYVRWSDIKLAEATAGVPGRKATLCAQAPKQHWWDPTTKEIDEPSGEWLVWCGRRGCTVGVVQVPSENGGTTPVYRHRPR